MVSRRGIRSGLCVFCGALVFSISVDTFYVLRGKWPTNWTECWAILGKDKQADDCDDMHASMAYMDSNDSVFSLIVPAKAISAAEEVLLCICVGDGGSSCMLVFLDDQPSSFSWTPTDQGR